MRLHRPALIVAALGAAVVVSAAEPPATGAVADVGGSSAEEADALAPATPSTLGVQATPVRDTPRAVIEAMAASRIEPLPARMKAVSDPLLGAPYQNDPLGEGEGIDADPLARYDVFDCLTFVEEVLALSLAGEPGGVAAIRKQLRYGGAPVAYENRRHFMELQWIPSNVRDGWLRDTTKDYGETVRVERQVTADMWKRWRRRQLFALTDAQLPTGTMSLEVLPLEAAIAAVDRIRPGSIVLTVRADRAWSPIWTTHIGITVPADRPTMRNASRRSALRVLDESLAWYLNHLTSYTKWPVAGIAVFEPQEPGPRRSAAPSR